MTGPLGSGSRLLTRTRQLELLLRVGLVSHFTTAQVTRAQGNEQGSVSAQLPASESYGMHQVLVQQDL